MVVFRRKERRTTSTNRISQTPFEGEFIYETDTKKLYIGDGITAGGIEVATGEGGGYTFKTINNESILGSGNIDTTYSFKTINNQNIVGSGNINITYTSTDFDIKDLSDSTNLRNTWNNKQSQLISGTNIKTINGSSLLGSGNITITSGGGEGSSVYISVARDGTGDYNCDGTADQVQIQQAIDYVLSIGGGTVYIKSGSYVVSSPIVPKSNVNVIMDKSCIITRTGNLKIFHATSQVENITFEGGRLCNDGENNEIFNMLNINNSNLVFRNITFIRNGGRAIMVGGDFKVESCYGIDIAQGIGTNDISSQESGSYKIPQALITNCYFENKTHIGDQNEGIDINWHNEGYAVIDNCVCKGFHDASFELNCKTFVVSNCIAISPNGIAATPAHFAYALKEGATDGRFGTGSFSNCIVRNISGGGGFYADRADRISFNNCHVEGTSISDGSIGFRTSGADGNKIILNGCSVKNVQTGVNNSMGTKCTVLCLQDVNVATRINSNGGTTSILDP